MAKDEYGIYRKPAASSIAAWLGVSAAIFFGAYSMNLKGRLSEVSKDNLQQHQEIMEYKSRLLNAEVSVRTLQARLDTLEQMNHQSVASRVVENPPAVSNMVPVVDKAAAGVTPTVASKPVAEPVELAVKPVYVPEATQVQKPLQQPLLASSQVEDKEPEDLLADAAGNKAGLDQALEESGMVLRYIPETRKVVIDRGSTNSDLTPGKRFTLWRDGKYVTDIRVTQVFGVQSTCEVSGPTPIGVKLGDIAKLVDSRSSN